MKLKFKQQAYQTRAVESVVDCFKGQPKTTGISSYRIDPGKAKAGSQGYRQQSLFEESGFKNNDLVLKDSQILENIQKIQREQNLSRSSSLVKHKVSPLNLDVEMETGTGKTYCYIKTIFEMKKRFSWSKFIIVVPSIAIREGVYKSLKITAEHFQEIYSKKAKFFIYNSKQLHNLESFSSDAGINVMVINVQAFNSRGKDNRRIYEELDDFQSRRPIDVIKANRPILILDEPQKMEGAKTLDSLKEFNPLFILRYSATHKNEYNKVHRLDAVDAYNQKLVKKIAVRGISVKGFAGSNAYLYLEAIEVSKQTPVARIELEVKRSSGIKRMIRKLKKGGNIHNFSGELDQYKGFVIADINAITDTVEFTNGLQLQAGEAIGDVNETALRRLQIREAVKAHFEKEQVLFHQGIKVLTLFFIDKVAKYRVYTDAGEEGGEYAKIFEEEYEDALNELKRDSSMREEYKKHLDGIPVARTHNGYFSIDKKRKMVDTVKTAKSERVESTDQSAYDLILKDKERLLSFNEPTRFIFSHSALREGWDNPNVFVICTLKHSDNTISRRQEVGRGLRIAVNQLGDRQDDNLATVHETNVLTVVASESYKDFVTALQKDISESLSESVYKELPVENGRGAKTNPRNANFEKKEFKELWNRINCKAAYSVHFDSDELVEKCIRTLNKELYITRLQYTVQRGEQADDIGYDQIKLGDSFKVKETFTKYNTHSIHSAVKYDLIGKVAKNVILTRKTVAEILKGVKKPVFAKFKTNPENFISEAIRLIKEQKATVIIEGLSYNAVTKTHDIDDIFPDEQSIQDFSKAIGLLKRHVYDYVITDSKTECAFVQELDISSEVIVYAKLPKGFSIPTPVSNYNPDWAISFKKGSVKYVYFVAETKGSISSMELRGIEKTKIECARKFFDEINCKINSDKVRYDVVNSFGKLMEIVGAGTVLSSGGDC